MRATTPRRVFNSPLVKYTNYEDGHINMIRMIKPYKRASWAIVNARTGWDKYGLPIVTECLCSMHSTRERADAAYNKATEARQGAITSTGTCPHNEKP